MISFADLLLNGHYIYLCQHEFVIHCKIWKENSFKMIWAFEFYT